MNLTKTTTSSNNITMNLTSNWKKLLISLLPLSNNLGNLRRKWKN
jgi:hypothetical protein